VRSTIEVAYRGLDDRALLRLLSLLSGKDVAGGIVVALSDTTLAEAEDVLETLVDAQMLDVVSCGGYAAPRYRCHDLIRVFAREQLMATWGENERWPARSARPSSATSTNWPGIATSAERQRRPR
jgi:hypothetical protein